MKQITKQDIKAGLQGKTLVKLPGVAPQKAAERVLSELKHWDCALNILEALKR